MCDEMALTHLLAEQPKRICDVAPETAAVVEEWTIQPANKVAFLEVAGRDSIAAAIRAYRDGLCSHYVPTIVYNGVMRGSPQAVFFALEVLEYHLPSNSYTAPLVIGYPELWETLSVRNLPLLYRLFECFPGFVACHLYLHAIQVPACYELGVRRVLTGERRSHDGEVKLSQTPEVLELYRDAMRSLGVDLVQPLREIESGVVIEETLSPIEWAQGEHQLRCILSGSYKSCNGSVSYGPKGDYRPSRHRGYLEEFAVPFIVEFIRKLVAGKEPDPALLAEEFLDRLTDGS